MQVHTHPHAYNDEHVLSHTPIAAIRVVRASIPVRGDAWRFSVVGGGKLATAVLGVLKVIHPRNGCNVYRIVAVTASLNLQYIFDNCFTLVLTVPW